MTDFHQNVASQKPDHEHPVVVSWNREQGAVLGVIISITTAFLFYNYLVCSRDFTYTILLKLPKEVIGPHSLYLSAR